MGEVFFIVVVVFLVVVVVVVVVVLVFMVKPFKGAARVYCRKRVQQFGRI